jgi:oxygen-dependent protoporphyrinogen oxidase
MSPEKAPPVPYPGFRNGVRGRLVPGQKHVKIVGGGMAGLLSGLCLKQAGFDVSLMEKTDRLGGWVRSHQTQIGPLECAATGIYWDSSWDTLTRLLGLDPISASAKAKKRYLIKRLTQSQFRMVRWPLSFWESVQLFYKVLKPLPPKLMAHLPEMTVQQIFKPHLGQKALDMLVEPVMQGIYADDASRLGITATLPTFSHHLEATHRLLPALKAVRQSFRKTSGSRQGLQSFVGGMQHLVDAFESRLKDQIKKSTFVSVLDELPKDQNIILATPAHAASRLLHRVLPELSDLLAEVKYIPLINFHALVRKSSLTKVKPCFGCLVPGSTHLKSLGVLFPSWIFPDLYKSEEWVVVRVILGGTRGPELMEMPDSDVMGLVERELRLMFEFRGEFEECYIDRIEQALPAYGPELITLWKKMDSILESHPGLVVFGNYTGQISLRGLGQSAVYSFTRS